MKTSHSETTIVSICLKDSSYWDKFDINILERENFRNLKGKSLSKVKLMQLGKNGDLLMPEAEMLIKEIDLLEGADLKAEFYDCLKDLVKNKYSDYIRERISEALGYLNNDDVNSAIYILKKLEPFTEKSSNNTLLSFIDHDIYPDILKTGISAIDNNRDFGGLYTSQLFTIGGDTGSMKTRFSLYLIMSILKANPEIKGVYFEKEMDISDVLSIVGGSILSVSRDEVLKKLKNEEGYNLIELLSKDKEACDLLQRLIIVPPERFDTVHDMYSIIEENDAKVFVLDYLQILGEQVSGKKEMEFIWEQSLELKRLVRVTKSLGIVLAQFKQNSLINTNSKIGLRSYIEYGSRLNTYSSYIGLTFLPILYNIRGTKKNWFYLVIDKNRFGSVIDSASKQRIAFPFYVEPEIEKFESEFDLEEKRNSLNFLINYMRTI